MTGLTSSSNTWSVHVPASQESEAESVRFRWRRVTKVGPEVNMGFFGLRGVPATRRSCRRRAGGRLGCERRTRALPGVSGGGERHDRFSVVVGERVVEPRIEGLSPGGSVPQCHAHPLFPEPEMAQDALNDILLIDERSDANFPCCPKTACGSTRKCGRKWRATSNAEKRCGRTIRP
jgi:hypothetical protein